MQKKSRKAIVLAAAAALAGLSHAVQTSGATRTWNNTNTNFNDPVNWGGTLPGTGDTAAFSNVVGTNPTLSGVITVNNLNFSAGGYTLASSGSALTLLSTNTSTTAAIALSNGASTIDTISAPIILGQASATTAKFNQTSTGSLTVSGVISSTNSPNFVIGGGSFTLSGSNNYTGQTQVSAATLNINNANALGGSTLTAISGSGCNIDNTSGAAEVLSNSITLSNRNLTFIGTNGANSSLTFTGLSITGVNSTQMNVTTAGARLTFSSVNFGTGRVEQASGAGVLVLSGGSNAGAGFAESLGGVSYNSVVQLASGLMEVDNAAAFGNTGPATSNVVKMAGGGIQAGATIGGAIGNTFVVAAGNATIGGSNPIQFSGDFILNNNGGINSRTIFVTNTAGTKWSGFVSLSDASGDTDNTLTFDVPSTAGATEVGGVIRDSNTGTGSSNGIIKQNTGTLLLSSTNTYTGNTAVRDGTLQISGSVLSPSFTLGNNLTSGRVVLSGAGGTTSLNLTSLSTSGTGINNVIVGGNSLDATNSLVTINPAADQPYAGAFGGAGANENKIALTKTGAFKFTISGPNNTMIAGPVNVSAGTLAFGGSTAGTTASTGPITVFDNATFSGRVNATSSTRVTSTSLALGSAGNANINFDFGGLGNPSVAIISTGALTVPGATVTLTASNATALSGGSFTLITYSGTLSDTDFGKFNSIIPLGGRASGALSKNQNGGNGSLNLAVTIAKPTWAGNVVGGVWDKDINGDDSTGTKNWQISAVSTCYREPTVPGDSVIFDDSATGTTTVNITATVSPASVTMNNSSKDYTFTGTSSIAGGTSLIKSGTGKLTIDNVNTYTGATTVNAGGTIELTSNGQVAGALVLNSATANLNGTLSGAVLGPVTATSSSAVKLLSATAIPAGITLTDSSLDLNGFSPTIAAFTGSGASTVTNSAGAAATMTLSGTGTTTYTGAINDGSGTVALTKTVGGQLVLGGTNNYSGGTAISAGSIQANSNSALGSGTVTVSSGQLILGNGASVGNALIINGGGVSGQGILQAAAATDVTYGGAITINNLAAAGSGHFGGGAGSTLTLTGAIASSVKVGIRSGTVVFAAPGSSYTDIGSTVTSGGGPTLKLGANNGIATNATLNNDKLTFDLAGFNQTLVGLNATTAGAATTNSVTGTSTLTITGLGDFKGQLQDGGAGKLVALIVNDPGFNFTLESSNTHTGGTTLTDGQLIIKDASGSGGATNLTTINGGVFDIETSTTINSLAVNGGTVTSNQPRTLTFGGDNLPRTYAGTFTSSAALFAIQKNGSGTTTLTAANNYTGSTTANGGKLLFTQSQTATSGINASGGRIELAAAANPSVATNMFKTQSMTATSGGTIDLQNNKAIITNVDVPTISALVAAGRNGGTWDGISGIVTSQSNALPAQNLTTLAVALASDVRPGTATFGGIDPNNNDTLVMYTYNGDANLDGKVNADDYFQIDSNYNKSGLSTGFHNGDFNYDGQINGDDYGLIDAGFAGQSAAFSAGPSLGGGSFAGVSAVPEPASLGILSLLAAAGSMRRRRRHA